MTTVAPDRAPEWVAEGTPEPLRSDLARLIGESAILARATDLVRYASDASPYRLIPQVVVQPRDPAGVARVIAYGREHGIPVTFRAGGTSLNGQGQGAGILVDVRRHWRGVEILDEEATRVKVRPGTVLGHANRVLSRQHRKLGPDPASTDIATVGGVVANNSGGMRCGTRFDSYQTVCDMTFLTASGTLIDTSQPDAGARFAAEEPELAKGLADLRDEIRADSELSERIRRKFEIKNTTGYRLCAFLDADEPVEIFRRLIVGSEGTLALIVDATFETLPVPAHTTTAWLHFAGIPEACAPVPRLVELGASAVELMVAPALMVAAMNIPGAPQDWLELPPESAVLLVEFGSDDESTLAESERAAIETVDESNLIRPGEFTRERERIGVNWRVREGLHGLVGRLRVPGTALIVEDVCVPPARIAEAAADIQALLGEHGFLTGVAGHTSAGNLHFMLTPDFAVPADLERYEAFMETLVALVCEKYDGSLKAEHGTGVNMAPYVAREWGERATELMWRVKRLADPDGVLGRGVLLNDDPGVHLRNLKTTPEVSEVVDTCVECGFCEPVCPSQDLTTTPRQRIVLAREMARQPEDSAVANVLAEEFRYDGIETCAADGSCVLACPLSIDTGKFVKELRAQGHSSGEEGLAVRAAKSWGVVETASRAGLRTGPLAEHLGGGTLPKPAPRLPATSAREDAAAVYFPSCTNRIMGRSKKAGSGPSLPDALVAVSERAGMAVWIPSDIGGSCCGVPWSSKGHHEGHAWMARRTAEALWRWSDEGRLPVVSDASSCTLGLTTEAAAALPADLRERNEQIEVLDSVEWLERLLPNLAIKRKLGRIALHPTCATRHLGLAARFSALAAEIADEVAVPAAARCCGFAGDRGMLHPELTASATAPAAAELRERGPFDAYLSTNRTCEIGMERATGEPYGSIVLAVEELTR
ncbi:MAG: FAD-binding and (Fe-S)-binding domain-containing protein [Solirubrobacterales bacterium]